ncbi:Eukaryotic translation initiation factor [Drechslerella dactyloides]|uniref:Eukaryotic translation initiation factor 3 subunit L n=1 Tax=Drechslerella dactyloides TaxID=74499 RepID=A0AAD6NLQ6_DREDA|nr:Eukaryotic translation initiation factor [Drechslerella dactyloides]
MLARQTHYQHGANEDDDFDEEGILAASIVEAIQNDDDDPSQTLHSIQSREDDLQSRLQAAATPLEYQASLEARYASYDNYCSLFHYILNSNGPVELDLPTYYWAWDVIDEFIYQFNNFCAYRNRLAKKGQNHEEIASLKDNQQIWGCYSVLNMNEQLAAIKRGEDPNTVAGEYGSRPLYRMLGYFSIIGLLRVHCLLGDFTLALKTLDDIELNKKAVFARVMGAHFTTYYYVGFCYMMMGRYSDAIKAFSHILLYVARTKNFHNKSAQFDSISKTMDQMYALLAICVALCPTRLDDTIHSSLREKYADQFQKLQRGGPESLPVFEELFQIAAPKFISPIPPDFDNTANNVDPMQHHMQVFMSDVKNNMMAPVLRSYLKLYTSMDLHKLAAFLETDAENLRTKLLVFKQRSRQYKWVEGGLLSGEVVNISDLDFALHHDLIQISEAKMGRKLVDWYLRNLTRSYA